MFKKNKSCYNSKITILLIGVCCKAYGDFEPTNVKDNKAEKSSEKSLSENLSDNFFSRDVYFKEVQSAKKQFDALNKEYEDLLKTADKSRIKDLIKKYEKEAQKLSNTLNAQLSASAQMVNTTQGSGLEHENINFLTTQGNVSDNFKKIQREKNIIQIKKSMNFLERIIAAIKKMLGIK